MKFRKTIGFAASVLCALTLLFTAKNADVNIHVYNPPFCERHQSVMKKCFR